MESSFFQSQLFGEFQEKIPYRGKVWRIKSGTEECLAIKMNLPLNFSWLWIPYGPEQTNNEERIFKDLAEIAYKEKAIFARVEPPLNGDFLGQNFIKNRWSVRPAISRLTPKHSLIIDLQKTEEEILAQMKPKGRYNINVGKRHGVLVRGFNNPDQIPPRDFDAFYKILRATAARDGFGVHPPFFYEKLLETFGPHNAVTLFLAYAKHEVIGGIIVIFYKDTATYYYGASSSAHRQLMAPYLLQWEAIREARRRGMKMYDFLGIAPAGHHHNHEWAGITEFKKKFGGREITYPPAFDIIYKKGFYKIFRFIKKFR